MKNLKLIAGLIVLLAMMQAQAQNGTTGLLNSTTTNTFNYIKDGVKMPYQITVQESRNYKSMFDIADIGKVDKDLINTPVHVSKLITVANSDNPRDNMVIALRYVNRIADTFKVVSTAEGFAISVDNRTMEYIMGKGIYFADTADREYFTVDEFDRME